MIIYITGKDRPVVHSCNDTYNIHPVLRQKIIQSDYYKNDLAGITTFQEVVDEVYSKVTYACPHIPNTMHVSSAFCLLHKLFTLPVTYRQLEELINHPDSPFLRVTGLLYVRYVIDFKDQWSYFAPHVDDKQEFDPGANGQKRTIGKFIRGLIEDLNYFDTMLPRIPVTIQRTMIENLMKIEFRASAIEEKKKLLKKGIKVTAVYYDDQQEYEAELMDEGKNDSFWVHFTGYGNEQLTKIEDIRVAEKARSRSRERGSRSRSRSRGRSPKKESKEIDFSKEVLKRQREAAASQGGDYARRPTSYKSSLSLPQTTSTTRLKSRSPVRAPPANSALSSSSSSRRSRSRSRDRDRGDAKRQQAEQLRSRYDQGRR